MRIIQNDRSSKMEIPGETITQLIQYWGTKPDSQVPAFISFDKAGVKRQLTRQEVFQLSKRFAHRLKNLGVAKGDIVVNALPNCIERIVCDFGIVFSGAISMNGQIFRSDGEDFIGSLETCQCAIVIVDPSIAKGARDILLKEVPYGQEDCVRSQRLPHLRHLLQCHRDDQQPERDFLKSLSDPDLPEFTETVTPADLATVMTTSGSTGYSKLVKLTHANVCHFARQVKAIEPLIPGDRFINCAPLGWAGGFPQWYLGCGVTRYFCDMHDGPPANLPLAIWRTIVEEQIVYGFLSPMYVNTILSQPHLWENVSWRPRALCLAGQPVKKELLGIIGRLCDAVDINYGITECNLVTTHRLTEVSSYLDGCAGFPGYGVQMKIVDNERRELPRGSTGEVIMWSPALCQGYLHNESATQSSFTADGWFCTDDAGHIGPDGKLYVEGRQSDSILRGAYVLYPGWLEHKLRGVQGVQEVVVVAVPDPVLHHEICAFVVTGTAGAATVGSLSGVERTGSLENASTSSKNNADHAKDCPDHSKPLCSNQQGSQGQLSPGAERKTLDQIRSDGVHKPLSVQYNETHAKTIPVDVRENGINNGETQQKTELEKMEMLLRQYADSLEVLSSNDAMRMVPKYYIFSGNLPLTNTGKISRKEIKRLSMTLLGLEPNSS